MRKPVSNKLPSLIPSTRKLKKNKQDATHAQVRNAKPIFFFTVHVALTNDTAHPPLGLVRPNGPSRP